MNIIVSFLMGVMSFVSGLFGVNVSNTAVDVDTSKFATTSSEVLGVQ